MRATLSAAGRAFLRVFIPGILALSLGLLAAPNLNQAYAIGVAGLFALLAAATRTLQAFVPMLRFELRLPEPWGAMVDSMIQAAVGAFLTSVIGILDAPNLSTLRSLALAGILAILTAVLRAAQAYLSPQESPAVGGGADAKPEGTQSKAMLENTLLENTLRASPSSASFR